ncbi:ABC transporter ATP-binding protein [Thermogladius sp. KZ2Tp1]|uniref:ABC transporter ATP-binding protein n=1 Tax=Thermogladius sp. KZ2Tp1 TaxID=3136289 RepID=UPI003DAA3A5B
MGVKLIVEKVTKRFGGVVALNRVSINVPSSLVVGLIGPNGSGKTTLFNVVTGYYTPDEGRVLIEGSGRVVDITGWNPNRISRMGVARTFQIPRLIPSLTVLENMLLFYDYGSCASITCSLRRKWVDVEEAAIARAMSILREFGLESIAHKRPAELSAGHLKLVETLRGLMSDAKLFMLDEPFAGVESWMARKLTDTIRKINREKGSTFVIIEHRITELLEGVDYVYVLHNGSLLAEGKPDEVVSDERVIKAYLGK